MSSTRRRAARSPAPRCTGGNSATSTRAPAAAVSRRHWRARLAHTRTCTWRATTSPSWETSRRPPAPVLRPPNASTRETVELSVHAERAGATAVMIVPPFYDALSWRELLVHYTAVADAIDIPIMYYNLPSASGVTLTPAQFRELQQVGVTSLKDTGGDAVAATQLLQTHGPTLLNGWG